MRAFGVLVFSGVCARVCDCGARVGEALSI